MCFPFIDQYCILIIQAWRQSPQGVYQIGGVYARSCTVMGTSFGIFTLKNLASCAVQRGLGISTTPRNKSNKGDGGIFIKTNFDIGQYLIPLRFPFYPNQAVPLASVAMPRAADPNIIKVQPLNNNLTPKRMPIAHAPEIGNWFQIMAPSNSRYDAVEQLPAPAFGRLYLKCKQGFKNAGHDQIGGEENRQRCQGRGRIR